MLHSGLSATPPGAATHRPSIARGNLMQGMTLRAFASVIALAFAAATASAQDEVEFTPSE